MRKPAVAGYFYSNKKKDLIKEIEEKIYNKKFGPGRIEPRNNVIGIIVPHAGYLYSGYVAAQAYSRIPNKKLFIIIGPNHTGYGSIVSVSPDRYWETPLDKVRVDLKTAKEIVENSNYAVFDEIGHLQEHSIEVQLPFLQYLFGKNFSIVAVSLLDQSKEIVKDLSNVLCNLKKDFVLIASSDFTHYEPKEVVEKKDFLLIDAIKSLDVENFYKTLEMNRITACGYGAIAVLMEITKCFNGKIELISHMTSGDITGDYSSVVGYAALMAEKI